MPKEESKLESVKLIKYSGNAERWREWYKKVLAYATTKNFRKALTDPNHAEVDEKMRSDALNFLTMSLCGDAFSFVENADSAAEVWAELIEEYQPTDDNQIFDLQEEFLKCMLLKEEENPVMWFMRLEYINARLRAIDKKFAKEENDFKVHVKSNLPMAIYSELLVAVRKDFKTLSWKQFKTEIRTHYRQWKRNEEKESGESIMNTNDEVTEKKSRKPWKSKQFKGRCRNCGKYGHKAVDCPDKRDDKKKERKVKCWKCGAFGHYANKCPNKKEKGLFVGNVMCESDEEDDDMIVTYDSDEENESEDEMSLIMDDESRGLILPDEGDELKDLSDEENREVEIVMNIDDVGLEDDMKIKKEANDELSNMNVEEDKLESDVNERKTTEEEVDCDESRASKRFRNDETEWIRVGDGCMIVDDKKDREDLMEINEKWNNQYGILTEIEKMSEEMSKVSLTDSEEKSVVKLFEDDSEDEVESEKVEKVMKVEVKKEGKENVPQIERNYMIHAHDMDISDVESDGAESEDEIDLFAKNRKRKRCRKKRTKPRKKMTRKNVQNRENNKMKLKANWLRIRLTIDEFVKGMEANVSVCIQHFVSNLTHLFQTHRSLQTPVRRALKKHERDAVRPMTEEEVIVVTKIKRKNELNEIVAHVNESIEIENEKWLIDSGSTVHVTYDDTYMFDKRETNSTITVGTGNKIKARNKGSLLLRQFNSNKTLLLTNVLYVPSFNQNIISVTNLLQKGYKTYGDKNSITLMYKNRKIQINNTDRQNMYYYVCTRRKIREKDKVEIARMNYEEKKRVPNKRVQRVHEVREKENDFEKTIRRSDTVKEMEINKNELQRQQKRKDMKKVRKKRKRIKMNINTAHDAFGHMDEQILREYCKRNNIELRGNMKTCVGCMTAKAQRKPVRKQTNTRATSAGERIYVDTSGPYPRSLRGKKYWFKIVDDYSRKNWNYFMKKKEEVPDVLEEYIKEMKQKGIRIKFVRMDNAGEHGRSLRKVCEKYDIKMEYVAPSTPQHNGVVERSFAVDIRRLHAMMVQAQFTKGTVNMLWPYGIDTLGKLKNMSITSANNNKSPNELFGTADSGIAPYLIEFGRIGYVTDRTKIKAKMKPRSRRCIMVGYADNHSPDTYLMYNPKTRYVIMSRDIRWADFNRPQPHDGLNMHRIGEEDDGSDIMFEHQYYDSDDDHREQVVDHDMLNQGGSNIDDNDADKRRNRVDSGRRKDKANNRRKNNRRVIADEAIEMENDDDESDMDLNDDNSVEEVEQEMNEPEIIPIDDDDDNDDNDEQDINNDDESQQYEMTERRIRQPRRSTRLENRSNKRARLTRALRKIGDTSYNDDIDRFMREYNYSTAVISDPGVPKDIKEAMQGKEKNKWIPSIKSEVMNFIKRKSWKYVSIDEAAELKRKLIPCKWVFKIKDEQDGSKRYKTRLCVKGFHQIPGVDYTESFSPVATDATIQILLIYTLWKYHEGWRCEMFDVEAAFLNAELENTMYLKWPEGMRELGFITEEQEKNECIKLVRSMYGNVDAALRWQKCFVETCIDPDGELQCEQSQTDPCLLIKRNDEGEVILLIVCYVDDVLMSGRSEDIKEFMQKFKKKYNITELGRMKKHLGMWYEWKKDEKGEPYIKVTMDEMLDEIIKKFEKVIRKEVKIQNTPGYPGKFLTKIKDENKKLKQEEYRSIIGKTLYYVNKMDTACSNAIRELTQHLEAPGEEHWKALRRLIGFLKTRRKIGRIIKRPKELRVVGWSDSDYAKALERNSISGNICTIGGSIVYGTSKGQKCVCLSSTEAEYVAMSTLAQEIRFEQQLLDEIAEDEHIYPSIIYEDNIGAIFLAKNRQVGQRTKHIDIRAHFIRKMVEQKMLEVNFTKSENNYADILTKNVNQELFKKHSDQIDKGELKYEIKESGEMVMAINEEENDGNRGRKYLCLCCNKQQENNVGNDVENDENEETMDNVEDEDIEEIQEELNEMNIDDEIIEEDTDEEEQIDEESEEESFYVDIINENNEIKVYTQQDMIDARFAETTEELDQRYERSYQQRKAQQINEYMRKKKTEDMKVIDEFEKKVEEDIKRENEEWKQEAKREMQKFEEANLEDMYDIEEQTTYMRDVMAQRQIETDELLRENERRANEARWQTRRRMIMLERRMMIPEIEGMPDYREDDEEFEIELHSELDRRIDHRAYSSDTSFYDERGNYVRKLPWENRLHYARRIERNENDGDQEDDEDEIEDD